MKSKKQLGIWMDHSNAYLIALTDGTIVPETIEADPVLQGDEQNVYKDESHILNKEQAQLSAYYKKLADAILDYDAAVLFGPTDAKNELFNLIKVNHLFDKIEIAIQPSDNMTESERNTFVTEYFNTPR